MTAGARLSRRALLGLGLRERAEVGQDGARDPARSAAGAPVIAPALLSDAVPPLLAAAGIAAGQDVLDIGAPGGPAATAAAALGARVVTVSADEARSLPAAARSFDRVISLFDVTHSGEPRQAMDEVERVLRPGGVVAVAAWASAGLMGRVMRLTSGGRSARPERWGRYEGAQLLFSRFPDFELREHTLRRSFADPEAAAAAIAAPPAAEARLREHGRHEDGAFVLDLAYVLAVARKPDWA